MHFYIFGEQGVSGRESSCIAFVVACEVVPYLIYKKSVFVLQITRSGVSLLRSIEKKFIALSQSVCKKLITSAGIK